VDFLSFLSRWREEQIILRQIGSGKYTDFKLNFSAVIGLPSANKEKSQRRLVIFRQTREPDRMKIDCVGEN
jgi:hypothetical protein